MTYHAKYPKAADCFAKDREALLAFYDFPAEHWVHLRTSNVIESTFATIRHRTGRVKGAFSRTSLLFALDRDGECPFLADQHDQTLAAGDAGVDQGFSC